MILLISLIVVIFLFAGFSIFNKSKEKKREMELRAELIAKALELGRELPPELFQEKNRSANH